MRRACAPATTVVLASAVAVALGAAVDTAPPWEPFAASAVWHVAALAAGLELDDGVAWRALVVLGNAVTLARLLFRLLR